MTEIETLREELAEAKQEIDRLRPSTVHWASEASRWHGTAYALRSELAEAKADLEHLKVRYENRSLGFDAVARELAEAKAALERTKTVAQAIGNVPAAPQGEAPRYRFLVDAKEYFSDHTPMTGGEIRRLVVPHNLGYGTGLYLEMADDEPDLMVYDGQELDLRKCPRLFFVPPATGAAPGSTPSGSIPEASQRSTTVHEEYCQRTACTRIGAYASGFCPEHEPAPLPSAEPPVICSCGEEFTTPQALWDHYTGVSAARVAGKGGGK